MKMHEFVDLIEKESNHYKLWIKDPLTKAFIGQLQEMIKIRTELLLESNIEEQKGILLFDLNYIQTLKYILNIIISGQDGYY